MEESYRIGGEVIVFRDGLCVAQGPLKNYSRTHLAELKTGRSINSVRYRKGKPEAKLLLDIQSLSTAQNFKDINFQLKRGEIVGITGLSDSGRNELALALAGHLPRGLTGGASAIPKIHLPLQPVSVGTAELFTRVLGPPDEKRQEDVSNPASAFWNNSVSAMTCYPGATSAKFLRKLLVYGFDNVPLSLLLQMCTLFTPGGMRSREGLRNFFTESKRPSEITIFGENKFKEDPLEMQKPVINYVDAFANSNVPMLCIAADSDPIFPPEQVKAFAKRVNARYECVGDGSINDNDDDKGGGENIDNEKEQQYDLKSGVKSDMPEMIDANGDAVPSHMSHFDVLCGKRAPALVYPKILAFLDE